MRHEDYKIGWICALEETELPAAESMFDEPHPSLWQDQEDENIYRLGRIGQHNVVIACISAGRYGSGAAAAVAFDMKRTFKSLRFRFLVGIGGGVPSSLHKIRLGDVAVSQPTANNPGVIQYDLGKVLSDGSFKEKGYLNSPPTILLGLISALKGKHCIKDSDMSQYLKKMYERHPKMKNQFVYQGKAKDPLLFKPVTGNKEELQDREHKPQIHYGLIASGNRVIASVEERNRLCINRDILCFEMEAAGLMNDFPCLVIRGISDYADSTKNDQWQPYAAVVAAAFTKELLEFIPTEIDSEQRQASRVDESSFQSRSIWGGKRYDNQGGPQIRDSNSTGNTFNFQASQGGDERKNIPGLVKSPYVGRRDIAKKLENAFRDSPNELYRTQPKVFVITGMAGIGKSEVCKKYAFDHLGDYWGVFWVNIGDQDGEDALIVPSFSAEKDFVEIGRLCGLIDPSFESTKRGLSNLAKKWLLILDNADGATEVDYKVYFPSGRYGHIILTSRNPECAQLSNTESEELPSLQSQDAENLLLSCSGIPESKCDEKRPAAGRVTHELQNHTLALIVAGAFVRKNKWCPLEDYLHELAKNPENLFKFECIQDRSRYGSVYKTFEITIGRLYLRREEEDYGDALQLLNILAFLNFSDISETIFRKASEHASYLVSQGPKWPEDEMSKLSQRHVNLLPMWMRSSSEECFSLRRWGSACSLLESWGLINTFRDGNQLHLSIHSLICRYLQYRQLKIQQLENWLAASAIIALATEEAAFMQPFLTTLNPHILCCMEYANLNFDKYEFPIGTANFCQIQQVLLRLLWSLAVMRNTKYVDTTLAWIDPDTFRKRKLAVDRLGFLEQFRANKYFMRRQYKEYLRRITEVVEIRESALDHNDPYMYDAWYDQVKAHILDKSFEGAEMLVERIFDMKGISLDNLDKLTIPEEGKGSLVSLLERLSCAYKEQNRVEKATLLLEKVLRLEATTLGEDHPVLIGIQVQLSEVYLRQGNHQNAAGLLEEVVQKLTRLRSDLDLNLAKTRRMCAQAYRSKRNIEEAVDLLQGNMKIVATSEFQARWPDDGLQELVRSSSLLAQIYVKDCSVKYGANQRAIELLTNVLITLKAPQSARSDFIFTLEVDLLTAYVGNNKYHDAETLLADLDSRSSIFDDYPNLRRYRRHIDRARKALKQQSEAIAA